MKKQEFNNLIYHIVSMIPYGKVATYGQIAFMAGMPQCARQVGQAMHNAPEY
ncbi:MAG: ogt, partial [Caproiciproducens sp.]|nr:ogt [Caproiciproducens sp.]